MNHLTDLQCSMYVDEALEHGDVEAITQHLESCSDCQTRINEFAEEKRLIRVTLTVEDSVVVPGVMPKFKKPLGLREFAIANLVTGLLVWLAQFVWKALFGELVITAFSWFSVPVPDVYGLVVDTALTFFQEGTTMIDTYLGFIAIVLFTTTLTWLAFFYRRSRITLSVGLLIVCSGSLLTSAPATALELKRSETTVSIAENETIDDTLIIAAETVVVDGNVNGDLVAFGRRIVVNGSVKGNLLTFGESVTVRGQIGGSSIGGAQTLELRNAVVTGDFWGAGEKVSIGPEVRIGRNATIGTERAIIDGDIGRDLVAFAETTDVNGSIGEDVEAFSNRVNLLGDANIRGNLRFRSGDEDRLHRSSTAIVGGEVEFLTMPTKYRAQNRYLTGGFYLGQLFRLVSAFVFGVVLLWLVPTLRGVTIEGGTDGLKTAGIGLVALISLPIIMVLLAITFIGLPISVLGIFAWIGIIYAAKIVLASLIGQLLLAESTYTDNLYITLLAGLLTVIVAVNIPAIGGVISFLLTIVGIGLIIQSILEYTLNLDINRG